MGGGILLVQYHSLFQLLSTIYSDFKWNKQLFSSSKDIWTDDHLANYFVQWLKKQPKNETDLVNVIVTEKDPSGQKLLARLLKYAFRQYKWIYSLKSKKSQSMLKDYIQQLFTGVLLEEYKHPDIANLELDLFLPQYNIAFEYQVMKESYL